MPRPRAADLQNMYAWSPRNLRSSMDEGEYLRRAGMSSFRVQRACDSDELWQRLAQELQWWLEPSALRAFDLDEVGRPVLALEAAGGPIPPAALEMETELLGRALEQNRSLISNHPMLAPEMVGLGEQLGASGSVVHVLLLRWFGENVGVVAVHWLGVPRPGFERRSGFLSFWDNVGLAVAVHRERDRSSRELETLYQAAYFDTKTGLPNQAALERELGVHSATQQLGILVADFDGMREANAAFDGDYARGGDVLIRAVGVALERFAEQGEFAARMNTAGDEFCMLLPGEDEKVTRERATQLEVVLDGLEVPASHRHVYRGASVGYAVRRPGEAPRQVLGRASTAMRERKLQRQSARRADVA
jgi:diguanylate cyclase (GGDEF)-like protein